MKRTCSVLLICAMIIGGTIASGATTTNSYGNAQVCPDVKILLGGQQCGFQSATKDYVYPILYNGSTYLPIRSIGEVMGKTVNWDESSATITLSGKKTGTIPTPNKDVPKRTDVAVQIRTDFTVVIDDKTRTFQDANGIKTYPLLYNGSTYLPIRSIGELMGRTINWDDTTKTVILGAGSLTVTDADTFNTSVPGIQTSTKPAIQVTKPAIQISGTAITADQAKEIALNHAGATGVTASVKADKEDGRSVYDVEFNYKEKEYDYTIDTATGAILEYDVESGKHTPAVKFSKEEATALVLKKVPGATASLVSMKLDVDDGVATYEGSLTYEGVEYEFEIDAVKGTMTKWEIDD